MKKVLLSCFILLMAFSLSAHAQTKTLIAAADPWPPFADDKSPTEGLALEITRAAFATQGYEVQMVFVALGQGYQRHQGRNLRHHPDDLEKRGAKGAFLLWRTIHRQQHQTDQAGR